MSEVALDSMAAQDPFAEPVRSQLTSNSGFVLVLAIAMVVLLLAAEALIAAARVLLEPLFGVIRILVWLLFILGAAVAIILVAASGSAHGAGPTGAGPGQPPSGTLPQGR